MTAMPRRRPVQRDEVRRARILHVVDLSDANPWFNGIAEHYDRGRFHRSLVSVGPRGALHDELEVRGMPAWALDVTDRWAYPRAVHRLRRILRRERVDIVQTHGFHPSLLGLTAGTLARTPVKVLTRHYSDLTTLCDLPIHRQVDRLQALWADHVVAVSDAVKRSMLRYERTPATKISVVRCGYEFDLLRPRLSAEARRHIRSAIGADDRIVVVTVARLSREKGHEHLLRAVPPLVWRHPDLLFVLVGSGPLRQQLAALAGTLGVADHVRFLGWRADARELIEASDLVVHPSLSEAFCNVVIEAMALERPLVATDVGGAPEQVDDGETGILVPARDARALEGAIERVLSDGSAAEMGREARRRVTARFGIGRTTRSEERLYDHLLGRGSHEEVARDDARDQARDDARATADRGTARHVTSTTMTVPAAAGCRTVRVEPDLVYDVGMHRGEDTAFYLSRGFRVVGVEANPVLVTALHERFAAEIRAGRVVIVPMALGACRGTARLAVVPDKTAMSTAAPAFIERLQRGSAEVEMVEVAMTTLPDLVARHGMPHYMKVDIEGMDHAAVSTLAAMDRRPALLSIESVVAGPHASVRGVVAELRLLRRLGYRRFKLVDQAGFAALDGTFLDREGTPVVYHHPEGASGPFGDEAPGRWRRAVSITPVMFGRYARHHTLGEHGWFPSTRVGRRLREGARRLATTRVPDLHLGRQLGGYEWYDIHASR
jgi:FkbM family methyltransferase